MTYASKKLQIKYSMALFSGKGMVIFKLKDLEKSYIMDLAMHDITKTSHTTRFFASLKKVMPDLQMCIVYHIKKCEFCILGPWNQR